MVDVRYTMLFIIFLVFTVSGVVLIVENVDENLEAAIPLFIPAGAAVVAGLYLAFCVNDEYDYAGRRSGGFNRMFSRGPRAPVDTELGGGSRYDDGRSKYGGGGGGRSRYDDDGGRSRYDDGGRSRYDDEEGSRAPRKKKRQDGRSRYEDSRYDDGSDYGGSRYEDERRPKRNRDRRDRDRGRDRDRDRGRSPRRGRD